MFVGSIIRADGNMGAATVQVEKKRNPKCSNHAAAASSRAHMLNCKYQLKIRVNKEEVKRKEFHKKVITLGTCVESTSAAAK